MRSARRPGARRGGAVSTVTVRARSAHATVGRVHIGGRWWRCALGRGGFGAMKREGDGTTPIGVWPLRKVYYRADRVRRPRTFLPVQALAPCDGWCDAPDDRNYNRIVSHPYPASAERMWRADDLYDLVLVIGHNDRPRRRGRGSAIFLHIARETYSPTEGCVALAADDVRAILGVCGRRTRLRIQAPGC